MTYRDLLSALQNLSEDQLDSDICVHDALNDEHSVNVELIIVDRSQDVLDEGHPVIRVNN